MRFSSSILQSLSAVNFVKYLVSAISLLLLVPSSTSPVGLHVTSSNLACPILVTPSVGLWKVSHQIQKTLLQAIKCSNFYMRCTLGTVSDPPDLGTHNPPIHNPPLSRLLPLIRNSTGQRHMIICIWIQSDYQSWHKSCQILNPSSFSKFVQNISDHSGQGHWFTIHCSSLFPRLLSGVRVALFHYPGAIPFASDHTVRVPNALCIPNIISSRYRQALGPFYINNLS